uniref:Uncharacterized protein n=1 Tax=viral metagenome TaxID=1070528 RepID=A0A6M3L435_9ZZZZ
MKNEIRITYPFANVMGLFFPVGKLEDGGTCEFATPKCLKKCCAHTPGAGTIIGHEKKQEAYNFFLRNSIATIVKQIRAELKETNCNIFTWFASGDCPAYLTMKFLNVIIKLDRAGVIQTGFTRNIELWKECKKLSDNNKTLLTVENIKDIPKYSEQSGMYSVPNYEIGAIDIYFVTFTKVRKTCGCGGGYYEHHIKDSERVLPHLKLDCKACYEKKVGCFTKCEALKKGGLIGKKQLEMK